MYQVKFLICSSLHSCWMSIMIDEMWHWMESNTNYGKATKSKVGEEKGVCDEYRFSSKGVNMSIWGSQGRVVYRACSEGIEGIQYSVKKISENVHSFNEWIYKRVNLEWIWSEILEWPQWSLKNFEWSLRSLQNEWKLQIFTPNSL